jgi:hypothetical protein
MTVHLPTEDAKARVVERLAQGFSLGDAARCAGLNRTTVFRWRRDDPEFEARVMAALEDGLDAAEDAIRRHWRRDWRAAHATLAAKRRALFGTGRVEMTGPDGGPIQVSELSEVERAARVAALLAAAATRRDALAEVDELLK